jgi:ferritin-like metal-binding protein YciE
LPPADIQEQLDKYLTDAHSIEVQALVQMKAAPKIAGDEELARMYADHERETEEHKRLVEERLEARGSSPSRLKDLAGAATAVPFVLFAKAQPDTPGKLAAHALSYEHMEHAAYELLQRLADRAGDAETAEVARRIADQELAMAGRIDSSWDRAVDASLRDKGDVDLQEHVVKYLADAHALEQQSVQLLERAPKIVEDAELAKVFRDHLDETRAQLRALEARLEALGGSPNRLQDAALRLGALNWGAFFQAQPDTPAKLAAFAHAVEYLEVAGYEQLRRVAERAGDEETARVASRILGEERAAAETIAARWDDALDVTLRERGLTPEESATRS